MNIRNLGETNPYRHASRVLRFLLYLEFWVSYMCHMFRFVFNFGSNIYLLIRYLRIYLLFIISLFTNYATLQNSQLWVVVLWPGADDVDSTVSFLWIVTSVLIYPVIYSPHCSSSSSLSMSFYKAPSDSVPDCSHHIMVTDDPCTLYISSHILYIGLVAIYWAIIFCCRVIYHSTVHNPTSSRSSPICGYN